VDFTFYEVYTSQPLIQQDMTDIWMVGRLAQPSRGRH